MDQKENDLLELYDKYFHGYVIVGSFAVYLQTRNNKITVNDLDVADILEPSDYRKACLRPIKINGLECIKGAESKSPTFSDEVNTIDVVLIPNKYPRRQYDEFNYNGIKLKVATKEFLLNIYEDNEPLDGESENKKLQYNIKLNALKESNKRQKLS